MTARVIAILCTAALVTSLYAQSATNPSAAANGYVGEVSGTNVYIRSGPGNTAYPVVKLSHPARVTVVDKTSGWLKILPPEGCFSVILKKDVAVDDGAKTATVLANDIRPRAGGELRTSDFWAIQSPALNEGDKVQLLGEANADYYKIVPPKGVVFYISDQYVKTVTGAPSELAVATAVKPSAGAATKPASPARVPTLVEVPSAGAVNASDLANDGSAAAAFKAAEAALFAEYKKPSDQQNLSLILEKYLAINVAKDASLKPYVQARVQFLQTEIDRQRALAGAADVITKAEGDIKNGNLERDKIAVENVVKTTAQTSFAAEGILSPSVLFPGGATSPKRFIVRDPQTLRITAYIQCTSGSINLDLFTNKYVGVKGATVYDKSLGLDVVDAVSLNVLSDKMELPVPPKPVLKVEPPKPTAAPAVSAVKTDIAPPAKVEEKKPQPTAQATTKPAENDASSPVGGKPAKAKEPATPEFSLNETADQPADAAKTASPATLPVVDSATHPNTPVNENEFN